MARLALVVLVAVIVAVMATSAYHGKVPVVKGAFPAATRSTASAADRFASAVERWAATK